MLCLSLSLPFCCFIYLFNFLYLIVSATEGRCVCVCGEMHGQRCEAPVPTGVFFFRFFDCFLLLIGLFVVYLAVKLEYQVDLLSAVWNVYLKPNYDDDL
ncbi:hypothetical protein, conserved [Trypanosoma cruzi]|uniref:EGF-like domain-containing protein n=1 Tax=Trypanosoma cruzi (strain CL Brener) TaxID=353153 RepID=Q4D2R5_TRYCC|nr:hypothetical protein, conserved [Trypanosoma cruzi]EAN86816.1 hypothetical protein, conserved [Trypanosoma cruzi]|eukprot:XP_808667.1 hypothetical protein [Trypanosoma cruzi strain CL Brener]